MAVVATTTYLYADTSLTQYFIQGAELVDTGAWSSATSYAVLNVVQIGDTQYIAIAANTNTPPTAIVDEYWSTLVEVEEATPVDSSGSDWYARWLAEQALEAAWAGTQIGSDAYNLADAAYDLAATGTNIAWAAYYLAQIGTNTGSAAYDLAGSAYAIGTDAYELATSGSNLAWSAFEIAVAGTDAASSAQSTADAAYALAVIGTDAVIAETGTRSERDQILQNQITVLQSEITVLLVPNIRGSGSPVGVVTPTIVTQFFTGTDNFPTPSLWQAYGTTNVDWQQLT